MVFGRTDEMDEWSKRSSARGVTMRRKAAGDEGARGEGRRRGVGQTYLILEESLFVARNNLSKKLNSFQDKRAKGVLIQDSPDL